jgi:hypothetical protein
MSSFPTHATKLNVVTQFTLQMKNVMMEITFKVTDALLFVGNNCILRATLLLTLSFTQSAMLTL